MPKDGHTSQPAVGDASTLQDVSAVTWRCPSSTPLQENPDQYLWALLDIDMTSTCSPRLSVCQSVLQAVGFDPRTSRRMTSRTALIHFRYVTSLIYRQQIPFPGRCRQLQKECYFLCRSRGHIAIGGLDTITRTATSRFTLTGKNKLHTHTSIIMQSLYMQ